MGGKSVKTFNSGCLEAREAFYSYASYFTST
jgi:hypothetical protein